MAPIMAIDTVAASLSRRISDKTGRRASEIYKYAAPLIKQGLTCARAEEILTELCEIGTGLTLDELMEMVAADEN